MKRIVDGVLVLALLPTVFGPLAKLHGQEDVSFAEQLGQWLPGMGAEKIPDRQASQQALQDALFRLGAPGREAELAAACKVLAERLGPETAHAARIWLLKQLEFSAGAECVRSLAVVLDDSDAEIRDAARRALQNNPAPAATAELLGRLAAVANETEKVALANALGERRDPASSAALAKLLADRSAGVATAAAAALGKIAGTPAAAALGGALAGAAGVRQANIARAYLACADRLLDHGKQSAAATIYGRLAEPGLPRPVRLAALRGKLATAGDRAADMVLTLLASDDSDERAIAAGRAGDLIGPEAIRSAVDQFPKLPAKGQVLLLAALAGAGDKAAMPVAVAAAASDRETVCAAGIRALGKLGDAAAVPRLVEALTAGGDLAGPAGESLREIFGAGVDGAIVTAMQKAETRLRGTLIDVLAERRSVQAVPALLEEAGNDNAGIRHRAVAALGKVAEPKDVAAMIARLLQTEKGRERDDTAKAIVSVCNRVAAADQRAAPVIAVLAQANNADRCVLLPLLGRVGGGKALAEVQRAMLSSDAHIKAAGIRALCNWPDASVADALLDLAKNAADKTHATWALRAYIRVVTLPAGRPHDKTLALLKRALELAARDEEKRLVLSRAASARHIETVRWLLPYLDDAALSAEACRAIVELAHFRELMGPHQAEFRQALNKVISTSKDQRLIDRAKRYMTGL